MGFVSRSNRISLITHELLPARALQYIEVEVHMSKSFQVGLLSLCLTMPTYAATHHARDGKVVDVNAHALPPLPSSRHVVVVNSAQNAPRHHGVAGMFQRLHQWHMRTRARLYRSLNR
jgi:hypothetical protein